MARKKLGVCLLLIQGNGCFLLIWGSNVCHKGSIFTAINTLNIQSYKVNLLPRSHLCNLLVRYTYAAPDTIQLHPSAEPSAIRTERWRIGNALFNKILLLN